MQITWKTFEKLPYKIYAEFLIHLIFTDSEGHNYYVEKLDYNNTTKKCDVSIPFSKDFTISYNYKN